MMGAHRYGKHQDSTAPLTVRVGHGAGEHDEPLHPALVAQRRQLNDIAHTGRAVSLAAVNAAAPEDVKARIDAAILRVAGRGGEFSANDFRDMFPESGGIVGARVSVLARRHGWAHVGYVASTKANTHGHEIKVWRARGAVAA